MEDVTSSTMKFEDDLYPAGHNQMIFDFDDGSTISPNTYPSLLTVPSYPASFIRF